MMMISLCSVYVNHKSQQEADISEKGHAAQKQSNARKQQYTNNADSKEAVNKHCVSRTQVSLLRDISTGCIYKWVVCSANCVYHMFDIHKHFFPVKSEVSYTCGLIMKIMLLGYLSFLFKNIQLLKVIFKQQQYDFLNQILQP